MPILPLSGASSSKGALIPLGSVVYTTPSTGVGFNLPSNTTGFQDLMLVCSLRNETAGAGLAFYFNGDVGSGNYSYNWMIGDGATTSSGVATNQNYVTWFQTPSSNDAPNLYGTHIFHILNPRPSSSSPSRTVLYRFANDRIQSGTNGMMTIQWRGAQTLQALTVGATGGNFSAGSSFTLYGIRSIGQ